MTRPQGGSEEGGAGRVVGGKLLWKFWPDLIRGEADARPDSRAYAASLCADRLHWRDRALNDPAERAAPAAMRRANHLGDRILEQDRSAIGGEHAERDAGNPGDQAIGVRGRAGRPRSLHGDDRGAVDLA